MTRARRGLNRNPFACGVAALAVAALGAGLAEGARAQAIDPPAAVPIIGFADLVTDVAPAVVNISTRRVASAPDGAPPEGGPFEDYFEDFFERGPEGPPASPRQASSLGSGFVIDAEGHVVTNNHVVGDGNRITVVFNDETVYDAELIGRDPKTDLALLKIESQDGEPFPFVRWADSEGVRVGDWMIAIGNPFGFGSSVTAGIVSARGRDIRSGPYDDFIQVDAPINRGNSGGPSFNLDGEVIGINTAIFSPTGTNVGIGFAIPSNLAKPVINSLRDHGRVRRGWLGVRIQSVTPDMAETMGFERPTGARVASVMPGGPAADSTIRAGDVILRFAGKEVSSMRALPRIVAETEIGVEVPVEVYREGERQTVSVTVGELPEQDAAATAAPTESGGLVTAIDELGLVVGDLNDERRESFGLAEDAAGVVVVEIEPNGPAGSAGLEPGDLIVELGQEAVGSPPELYAKINEAVRTGKRSVLLLIDDDGDRSFVVVRLTG